MTVRWDFGKIYKQIRESKGLTQAEVCDDMISRTSLAKIESGQVVPKYENMIFLLDQINMSHEEFEYICNYYQPSQRQEIFNRINNYLGSSGTDELKEIRQLCEEHLKSNHDVPIDKILERISVAIAVRENGFLEPNNDLTELTQKIWTYLEKQDTWYERDIKMLNTILFIFPLDSLKETTETILSSLEKYTDYLPLRDTKINILVNLSSIFLHNGHFSDCYRLTKMVYNIAKEAKRYDHIARSYIRLGICQKNDSLISKGLNLLKALEEDEMLENCQQELDRVYYQKH